MKPKRYRLLSNKEIDELDISDEQKDKLRKMRFDKSGKFVSLRQNAANYIETAYYTDFEKINNAFNKRREEEFKRGGTMSVNTAQEWFSSLVNYTMLQPQKDKEGNVFHYNAPQAVQRVLRSTDFVPKEERSKQFIAEWINRSRMFQGRKEHGKFDKYKKVKSEDLNYVIKEQDGKVINRYWELNYNGAVYIIEEKNSPYIIVINEKTKEEYNLIDYFNDKDVYYEYRNTFKRL